MPPEVLFGENPTRLKFQRPLKIPSDTSYRASGNFFVRFCLIRHHPIKSYSCRTLYHRFKAYDPRSDLSQTTCWIRQNLRMSDRLSPPKTPLDTIVYIVRHIVPWGVIHDQTSSDFVVSAKISFATSIITFIFTQSQIESVLL